MKKEIREYFEQMGYPTHELVNKNRRGLNRQQIEPAMKLVYGRLSEGEEIKQIDLARSVWAEAENLKSEKMKDLELEYEEKKIQQLSYELQNYKDKFYAALVLCGAIIYVLIAVSIGKGVF
jgi:hypothetical protein